MTDFALNLLTLNLATAEVEAALATAPAPTVPGSVTAWVAKSVLLNGEVVATFTTVSNPVIQWTIDAEAIATFDIPFDTPDIDLLPTTGKTSPNVEVQLWRNGHVIFWGPVTGRRASSSEKVWHYTAKDPLFYLRYRNMGQANRHDYLDGAGQFDGTFAGWTQVGGFTPAVDFVHKVSGTSSLRVFGGAAGGDQFFRRRFTISAGAEGLALFMTAWVWVDTFTAGALQNRGSFIQRLGATGPASLGIGTINATEPARGSFQRLSCHCVMPPNTTETIEARLYAWDGSGNWDAVTITIEESLSFIDLNSPGGAGWDQVQIAMMTSRYLSGAFPIGGTYTKSDLFLPVSGVLSGIKKERTYQFVDHQPGYQGGVGFGALDEWNRSNDGFDQRLDIDSPTKRTHRFYYPAVGVTWDAGMVQGDSADTHTAFEWVDNADGTGGWWGITDWTYADSLEQSATDVCELGNSPIDSGREEGAFSNDAALGGITMELVEAASADAPIDALAGIAAQRGAQLAKVIETPSFTFVEPKDPTTGTVLVPLVGVLMPGDILPLHVVAGSLTLYDDLFRVTTVTLNADDSLSVEIDV